jgi:crotonobetainyl-CoA:carnitine CoA-transferase CaiB-like acyl-CoA transferase
VVASQQLAFREFFRPITTPAGRSILAPGAPYTMAETPWLQRRPGPRLGEHTDEIKATTGAERG